MTLSRHLVAVEDDYRESAADWHTLLTGLRERGLPVSPKLAIADDALGFWKAMEGLTTDQEEPLAFYDFPAEHWSYAHFWCMGTDTEAAYPVG